MSAVRPPVNGSHPRFAAELEDDLAAVIAAPGSSIAIPPSSRAPVPATSPPPQGRVGPASLPPFREPPRPLAGGPLALLRFARANHMLSWGYARLLGRFTYYKLRYRERLVTDGPCFILPGVKLEIGRDAKVTLGRWSWIGNDSKIRAHEGHISIGAKSVIGQECTISCYQRVSIGRECIIADRSMLIDFDHGTVEIERPIREQGIYKRDVSVGHNVWIGYGTCVLRGVRIGDNCVIGTSSVITRNVPDNAVACGAPARVVRIREAPRALRWG